VNGWLDHLMILPIVLPLMAGAAMLLVEERHRAVKAAISLASILVLMGVSIALLNFADAPAGEAAAAQVGVYRLGDWPPPFGIVLVVDRLSALMLLLTSALAFAAVLFSLARWHRVGAHFHSLFQFLLMGLNGAFLTGDLFNLFVFFELLLAASYGLALHGSGTARVKAGLHYIAINLAASFLFLIGASLMYGVTGTLNMADLAVRIPALPADERVLMEVAAGVLAVVFLVKAGAWPLSFWLPTTYSAAAPPVGAIFAMLSKVGVYVLLRIWLLLFGEGSGASAGFGGNWLLFAGIATVTFGSVGALASQAIGRLAGFVVLVSSGTVLAVIGTGHGGAIGPALFYLVSSTLAIAAFFMLVELVERGREPGADILAVTQEAYGDGDETALNDTDAIGVAIPASMAVLGICFMACALVLAGLPPLSGFIAKFAILTAMFDLSGQDGGGDVPTVTWGLLALLILSGLTTLIAMTRAGMRSFWTLERTAPRVRFIEVIPVAVLLIACAVLTVRAEGAMRYMTGTAAALDATEDYVRAVLPGSRQATGDGGAP
jgi:multicomponent K+:H+ antiporter subunit D